MAEYVSVLAGNRIDRVELRRVHPTTPGFRKSILWGKKDWKMNLFFKFTFAFIINMYQVG